MEGRILLNKILPLLIILSFLKGVFSQIVPYLPFDLYSALSLSLIPLLSINFYSFFSLFLLALLKSLDTSYTTFILIILYFIFFISFQHLQKNFKTETSLFRFLFWGISLLCLLFVEIYIFFNNLSLTSLDYSFWITFLIKIILYFGLSFLLCNFFYNFFRKIIK